MTRGARGATARKARRGAGPRAAGRPPAGSAAPSRSPLSARSCPCCSRRSSACAAALREHLLPLRPAGGARAPCSPPAPGCRPSRSRWSRSASAVVAGRIWCGWICPLGTLLGLGALPLRRPARGAPPRRPARRQVRAARRDPRDGGTRQTSRSWSSTPSHCSRAPSPPRSSRGSTTSSTARVGPRPAGRRAHRRVTWFETTSAARASGPPASLRARCRAPSALPRGPPAQRASPTASGAATSARWGRCSDWSPRCRCCARWPGPPATPAAAASAPAAWMRSTRRRGRPAGPGEDTAAAADAVAPGARARRDLRVHDVPGLPRRLPARRGHDPRRRAPAGPLGARLRPGPARVRHRGGARSRRRGPLRHGRGRACGEGAPA